MQQGGEAPSRLTARAASRWRQRASNAQHALASAKSKWRASRPGAMIKRDARAHDSEAIMDLMAQASRGGVAQQREAVQALEHVARSQPAWLLREHHLLRTMARLPRPQNKRPAAPLPAARALFFF